MKAYDMRMVYEEKLYAARCRRCGAEIEGELKEFKLISRFYVTCHCPACNAHNTIPVWKLRQTTIIKGIREIQKLEV